MVDESIIEIGKKIRQLRRKFHLSLRDLAQCSGTSASTIHKIESNSMVPSIAVLIKIAQALKKNVSYFIGDENGVSQVVHVRPKDREVLVVKDSKLTVENIASSVSDCQLEVTLLHIKQGGTSGEIPLIHSGEEIKFCLRGKMEYTIENDKFILGPGDCLHFKSGLPHSWRNIGRGGAEILSVCNPPPFRSLLSKKRIS
jgi:transcriptional regulator with XRE-family HTH domain